MYGQSCKKKNETEFIFELKNNRIQIQMRVFPIESFPCLFHTLNQFITIKLPEITTFVGIDVWTHHYGCYTHEFTVNDWMNGEMYKCQNETPWMCVWGVSSYLSLFHIISVVRWSNNKQRKRSNSTHQQHTHTHTKTDASKMPIEKEEKECYWPPPIVIALRINKITNNSSTLSVYFVHVYLFRYFLFLFCCKFHCNNIFVLNGENKRFEIVFCLCIQECVDAIRNIAEKTRELREDEQCLYDSLLYPIQYPDEHSFKSVINQRFVVFF